MKKISILILLLSIVLSIYSCKKDSQNLTTTITHLGNCIPNDNGVITEEDAAFSYHASTSTLSINKFYNFYPCDSEIKILAEIKDNIIQIVEQVEQTKECTCPKDISYTIGNIPSGFYKISINSKIVGEILIY